MNRHNDEPTRPDFHQQDCDRFAEMIFQLDDGAHRELSRAERKQLHRHLRHCQRCHRVRQEEQNLTDLLREGGHETARKLPTSDESAFADGSRLPVIAAVAALLLLMLGTAVLLRPGKLESLVDADAREPLVATALGSINTRPVVHHASLPESTAVLETTNHIELPAGAVTTIELSETGTISAIGPVVMEIDRIDENWKVTVLAGQANITVLENQRISVASQLGSGELTTGEYLIRGDGDTFVSSLEIRPANKPSNDAQPDPQDSDEEKSVAERYEDAMSVFSANAESTPDSMRRSAKLLKTVIDSDDATETQRLSAGFYLPAALANSGQHASALREANAFREKYPGLTNDVILAIIADCHRALGNTAEAKKAWSELLKKYPDSPFKPHIQLAMKEEDASDPANDPDKPAPRGATPTGDSKLKVLWTRPLDAPSFGGAAVADVDGDGNLEIAFGTYFGDNSVRVLNGKDGEQRWRFDAGHACLDASLRFYDLNSDGNLELLVPISNKGQMIAFAADTGKQLWSYQPAPTECTDSPSTILDLDGDGVVDFVYGTFLGNLHTVNAKTGEAKRIYKVSDEFIQTAPTVVDLNGDDTLDFVCATFKGKNNVYAIDGKSGERLWESHIPGEHIGMYHGCSAGDLDGDGKIELVIAAYDGKVYCLNPDNGSKKWVATPGDRYFMSPTVIADLDDDGDLEVIVASQKVSVIDHTGKILWSKPCAIQNGWDSATRGPSIADLNGDFQLDITTLNGSGEFQVLSGHNGDVLYEFSARDIAEFVPSGSSHGVTIADFNGDKKLDVFFVVGTTQKDSKAGMAICLTGFEGSGRGWYMLRHDPRSTGNLETEIAPSLLKHIEKR